MLQSVCGACSRDVSWPVQSGLPLTLPSNSVFNLAHLMVSFLLKKLIYHTCLVVVATLSYGNEFRPHPFRPCPSIPAEGVQGID